MKKSMVLGGFVALVSFCLGGVAFASHDFSDVPDAHPFHEDISWLASTGITEGFPDGTYRPAQPVTRQSMAAFLRRLAGADPAVPRVVDAAKLGGRTPTDFDDAGTLDGFDSEDLLDHQLISSSNLQAITGTTPATATTVVAPFDAGFNSIVHITAVVDTSFDSGLFTCLNGDTPIPGLVSLRIGDSAVGYADRVSVSGLFERPPLGEAVRCYYQIPVGTGTIELENMFISFEEF